MTVANFRRAIWRWKRWSRSLERRRVVHFHTHRHDDILTVLGRLQKEFGFRVVLHHVSEAWKVAGEIAAAKIPASIILIDSPGGKLETADIKLENAAALGKSWSANRVSHG